VAGIQTFFDIFDAECRDDVAQVFLPLIVSACRFRQYTLHYIFFETVTKTLPSIAENLVTYYFWLLLLLLLLLFVLKIC
jgi:hypothetical protein